MWGTPLGFPGATAAPPGFMPPATSGMPWAGPSQLGMAPAFGMPMACSAPAMHRTLSVPAAAAPAGPVPAIDFDSCLGFDRAASCPPGACGLSAVDGMVDSFLNFGDDLDLASEELALEPALSRPPLGLRLKKSESLLDLINRHLNGVGQVVTGSS